MLILLEGLEFASERGLDFDRAPFDLSRLLDGLRALLSVSLDGLFLSCFDTFVALIAG